MTGCWARKEDAGSTQLLQEGACLARREAKKVSARSAVYRRRWVNNPPLLPSVAQTGESKARLTMGSRKARRMGGEMPPGDGARALQFSSQGVHLMGNLPSVPAADLADDPIATGDRERGFAEVLAGIVGTEHVSVDSHFFDDLGADSMLMARFCARVRKRDDLPTVSMPDVYEHPTVRSLAAALAGTAPTPAPEPAAPAAPAALVEPPRRARNGDYILCGALQLLFILGYPALTMVIAVKGIEWIAA